MSGARPEAHGHTITESSKIDEVLLYPVKKNLDFTELVAYVIKILIYCRTIMAW